MWPASGTQASCCAPYSAGCHLIGQGWCYKSLASESLSVNENTPRVARGLGLYLTLHCDGAITAGTSGAWVQYLHPSPCLPAMLLQEPQLSGREGLWWACTMTQ